MSHEVSTPPLSQPHWRALLALSAALALSACGSDDGPAPTPTVTQNATAQLALLETTDLHYYARSYNYYSDKEDKTVGLERTATLIH